jgi:hypothetical protein
LAKYLACSAQTPASFLQKFDQKHCFMRKNADFSQKIVIITSPPEFSKRFKCWLTDVEQHDGGGVGGLLLVHDGLVQRPEAEDRVPLDLDPVSWIRDGSLGPAL